MRFLLPMFVVYLLVKDRFSLYWGFASSTGTSGNVIDQAKSLIPSKETLKNVLP